MVMIIVINKNIIILLQEVLAEPPKEALAGSPAPRSEARLHVALARLAREYPNDDMYFMHYCY